MVKEQKQETRLNAPGGGTLGEDVCRVREARRLSQKALAHVAGYSVSYVSKVEAGAVLPSPKFAEGCDKAFGTGDLFARQLRRLVNGEHPSWFAPYVDAEREASDIRDFSITFVMGLFQTEDYARAALRGGRASTPERELDVKVASRLRRREILERPDPPRVWVVLHEACLRVQVGSARVMADQLDYMLRELRQHPTLTVQVLPYSAAESAIGTPYTILEIPDGKPVVYVEGPQGGRPYETPDTVANSVELFDHLRACALSPHDSVAYISTAKEDHERNARVDQVQLQRPARRTVRRVGPGSRVRRGRPRAGQ